MTVRRLDDGLVDLIAAGEVVERPASVVKELVENALDAGAKEIRVAISGGGSEEILCVDDGCGMDPQDAVLALERHATSKIASVDDLSRIGTLGFRGEALPSMAAVSKLELVSRAEGGPGVRLVVEGGVRKLQEKSGAPVGTSVRVRELFYNTPARRAFLKSAQAETAKVSEVVTRLALSRPEVRFDLASGERTVLRTPGDGNLVHAAAALLGLDTAESLQSVDYADGVLRVRGLISRPTLHRASRAAQFFFVNGRPTQHLRLRYAAEEAYRGLLMKGSFPVLILFVELSTEAFDPNVHPAKLEVRFRDEQGVARIVHRAVQEAVRPRPIASRRPEAPFLAPEADRAGDLPTPPAGLFLREGPSRAPDEPSAVDDVPSWLRPLAQVKRLYLLAEGPDGIYLVDQHAAHERVLYDRLQASEELLTRQQLLTPLIVPLPPDLTEQLPLFSDTLSSMGFSLDRLGDARELVVRGLPVFFGRRARPSDIRELLEELARGTPDPKARRAHVMMAMAACRAAIKREDALSPAEQSALLTSLLSTTEPRHCPHGRPTYLRLPFGALEARFERR